MKNSIGGILALFCGGVAAQANTYPLQFTPPHIALGAYTSSALYVAGYTVTPISVSGECDFSNTVRAGGGRGGHTFNIVTYYHGSCTWDLQGSPLSFTLVSGLLSAPPVPVAPKAVSVSGTVITYAVDGAGDTTGTNSNVGFVSHISADYTWSVPVATLHTTGNTPVAWTAILHATGDSPLVVSAVHVATRSKITSNGCLGVIATGTFCVIQGSYTSPSFDDPIAYYNDVIVVSVTSNGPNKLFNQPVQVANPPLS